MEHSLGDYVKTSKNSSFKTYRVKSALCFYYEIVNFHQQNLYLSISFVSKDTLLYL